jgi:diketogulonate reductase-like aldo/keto reductase
VQESFECSLKNLKTTYVDSYILHSPLNTLERTLEAWKVLCSLQDQGVVKQIGVSNTYDVEVLKALEKEGRKPQVVQNRWYQGNSYDRDVFKYCRQNQIYYQ